MESEYRDDKGRFTEGNPGGPGRPKTSVISVLRALLNEYSTEGDTRIRLERIVAKYLDDIEEHKDGVAIRDLIDRFDGKPKESLEVSGSDDHPIGIIIKRPGSDSD